MKNRNSLHYTGQNKKMNDLVIKLTRKMRPEGRTVYSFSGSQKRETWHLEEEAWKYTVAHIFLN